MGKSKSQKSIVITGDTTLETLISLGIIKSSQLDTWNRRLSKGEEKVQDDITQSRANQVGLSFRPRIRQLRTPRPSFRECRRQTFRFRSQGD